MTTDTESTNKRLDTIIYLLLKAQSPQSMIPPGEVVNELKAQGLELDVTKFFGEKGRQTRWGHQ